MLIVLVLYLIASILIIGIVTNRAVGKHLFIRQTKLSFADFDEPDDLLFLMWIKCWVLRLAVIMLVTVAFQYIISQAFWGFYQLQNAAEEHHYLPSVNSSSATLLFGSAFFFLVVYAVLTLTLLWVTSLEFVKKSIFVKSLEKPMENKFRESSSLERNTVAVSIFLSLLLSYTLLFASGWISKRLYHHQYSDRSVTASAARYSVASIKNVGNFEENEKGK